MADKWPLATGNWSNAANWNDGVKPIVGDAVYADGKNVTIDEDAFATSISTAQRSGGTAGGSFALNGGWTLTADVYSGTTDCLTASNGTVNGNCYASSTTASGDAIVTIAGTLVVNGNITGGMGFSGRGIVVNNAASICTVNGNVTGGTVGQGISVAVGTAVLNVNGNVTAGSSTQGISGAGIITVVGNVTGGSSGTGSRGIDLTNFGTLVVTGDVRGGSASLSHGVNSSIFSPSTVTINGDVYGGSASSAHGLSLASGTGTYVVNGDVTGGSSTTAYGINASLNAGGTVTVNGNATGGSFAGAHGVASASASNNITINGNAVAGSATGAGSYGLGLLTSNTSPIIVNGNAIGGPGLAPGANNGFGGLLTVVGDAIASDTACGVGLGATTGQTTVLGNLQTSSTGIPAVGGLVGTKLLLSPSATVRQTYRTWDGTAIAHERTWYSDVIGASGSRIFTRK